MKKQLWLIGLGTLLSHNLQSQLTSAVIDVTKKTTIFNTTRYGYSNSNGYNTSTNYNLFFGVVGSSAPGTSTDVPILKSFVYKTVSYVPFLSGAKPYDVIKLNRKNNATITNPNKFTGFFELGSGSTTTNKYYAAEYSDDLGALINSYTLNRGVDNIFANNNTTANNIERIDLITTNGMTIPMGVSTTKIGILIVERGGNDNYKLAAITALDTNGNVSALGTLTPRLATGFGNLGKSIIPTIFMNSDTPASPDLIRPNQDLGSQPISGDYITLSDLGLKNGQKIYGIATFPNDVTASMNLITLSDVPLNTDGNSDGGLDLMGGGGFVIAEDAINTTISGNVYRDMINNNIVDGIGIGSVNSSQLYAYVLNSSNTVLFKTIVNSNGSYNFPSELMDISENYTVAIDTNNILPLATLSPSYTLATGWIAMGASYGTNNTIGSGNTGTTSLRVPIKFSKATPSITNVNFGINLNCVKPGDFTTAGNPTHIGITNQTKLTSWPEAVPNGHITLESKNDGMVISRVANSAAITQPKKGMLIYDIAAACIKLYNGTIWNCIQKSCNQ